jgi:hypothetical protein
MTSEVSNMIRALRDGTMTLDQVAQQFRERKWPRHRWNPPASYLEMAARAQEDPEPYVPARSTTSPTRMTVATCPATNTEFCRRRSRSRNAPKIGSLRSRAARHEARRCGHMPGHMPGHARGLNGGST